MEEKTKYKIIIKNQNKNQPSNTPTVQVSVYTRNMTTNLVNFTILINKYQTLDESSIPGQRISKSLSFKFIY